MKSLDAIAAPPTTKNMYNKYYRYGADAGGAEGGESSSESGSAMAQNACVPFLFSSRMDPRTTLTTSGTSLIASNNLSK